MDLQTLNIAVVDSANRFVRWASRAEVHREHLVHRSVHVAVFTTAGELVLQRRHPSKQTHADCWDISCSGHVERQDYPSGPDQDVDRVFAEVAERELMEELGVAAELSFLSAFGPLPGVHYEYFHLFGAVSDGPFTLQPEEVSEVRSIKLKDMETFFQSGAPVTPSLIYLVRWLNNRGA